MSSYSSVINDYSVVRTYIVYRYHWWHHTGEREGEERERSNSKRAQSWNTDIQNQNIRTPTGIRLFPIPQAISTYPVPSPLISLQGVFLPTPNEKKNIPNKTTAPRTTQQCRWNFSSWEALWEHLRAALLFQRALHERPLLQLKVDVLTSTRATRVIHDIFRTFVCRRKYLRL